MRRLVVEEGEFVEDAAEEDEEDWGGDDGTSVSGEEEVGLAEEMVEAETEVEEERRELERREGVWSGVGGVGDGVSVGAVARRVVAAAVLALLRIREDGSDSRLGRPRFLLGSGIAVGFASRGG
ncbi:MAG: hypothetical protein FRX48_07657 [Lasallia pustulata]|uniref:Uncharacterized protein n=1 Tax=Lasallia pustulata TaxID=136370 RepID=A0A5M8PGX2_9LECA|nr:MAG: hypothetical protein FRX48_07657 [Lasallia pustulata]